MGGCKRWLREHDRHVAELPDSAESEEVEQAATAPKTEELSRSERPVADGELGIF